MSAPVYGEIHDDGKHILITVQGDDWDIHDAGELLNSLTSKCSTVPTGEKLHGKDVVFPDRLLVPLTYANVTQIAHTFPPGREYGPQLQWVPGPNLSNWVIAEVMRRSCQGDFTGVMPKELVPMPHQVAGAIAAGMNGRFLFADEMGPQPVTTPVLTPNGWTELGKLVPGDYVYSADGEPTRVEEVKFFGVKPVYRVEFSDRTSTLATGNHRWSVHTANDRFLCSKPGRSRSARVLSTEELLAEGLYTTFGRVSNAKWYLPQQPVISDGTPARSFLLPPYLYGALLGDGSLGAESLSFSSGDLDMLTRVQEEALSVGTTSGVYTTNPRCSVVGFHRNGTLHEALRSLDALHLAADKYVHSSYLAGDESVRRDLLRGLLDTDGHALKDGGASAEFVSVSAQLAAHVAYLGRSLGGVVTESSAQASGYVNSEGRRIPCQDKYRVHLRMPVSEEAPFWCGRKRAVWEDRASQAQRRNPPRAFRAIELAGEAEVCCIRVKHGAHVYLTDKALIPTHNTGKLLCSLMSLAEMEARNRKPWPCAAVVPASIIDTWLEEIAKCYPQWHAVAYRGQNRGRYLRTDGIDIFVMSYEAMRNDVGDVKNPGPLLRKKFGSVISDESHKICNYESKQSTHMRRLVKYTPNFIAATGTPITKNAGSFWPILNGMDPGSYPDRERYKSRYCIPKGHSMYGEAEVGGLNPVMEPEFRIVMQGTWRRVATADVVKDLPPKTYQTRWIDIPAKYRPAYDQMQEDMLAELPDMESPLAAQSTLAQMMRLSQLAHSACDVKVWHETEMNEKSKHYGEEVERTEVTMKRPCWKADALLELLGELHQDSLTIDDKGTRHGQHTVGSHPVIAFAPLKQLVVIAGELAAEHGYKVGYITGGISDAQRTATRHAFQNHELDLLGVTTGAGGVGLTLTAATTVAFLMRPWSYVEASQAEARAHRKGQTEHVQIVDFVAKNSIESRIRAALRDKAKNLSELVEDRRLVEEFLGGHGKKDDGREG